MQIKNKDVINVFNIIEKIKGVDAKKPASYIYKSAKNKKILQVEVDSLKEIEPKIRNEFINQQIEIQRKYVKVDENGNPVLKEGVKIDNPNNIRLDQVQFTNIQEMNKELTELANKVDWNAVKVEEDEYIEFLDKLVELDLVKYDKNDMFDGIDETAFGYLVDLELWDLE